MVHRVKTVYQGWQDGLASEDHQVSLGGLDHRVSLVSWEPEDCQGLPARQAREERGERQVAKECRDQWERQDNRVLPV